jgi:hypothetical protein
LERFAVQTLSSFQCQRLQVLLSTARLQLGSHLHLLVMQPLMHMPAMASMLEIVHRPPVWIAGLSSARDAMGPTRADAQAATRADVQAVMRVDARAVIRVDAQVVMRVDA